MKRKRILTALIVLALVFIWGNSLVSGELSGKISDNILLFMNAAAEKLGFGQDTFTYMTDEDGDGVAEQPTSHIIRKAAHVTEYAVFAALVFFRLESRGEKRFFTAWGQITPTKPMTPKNDTHTAVMRDAASRDAKRSASTRTPMLRAAASPLRSAL